MTIITLEIPKFINNNMDIFESLEQFQNDIDKLKEQGNIKVACFYENLINAAITGNVVIVYLFVFTIYLIPILGQIMFVLVIKNLLKQNK